MNQKHKPLTISTILQSLRGRASSIRRFVKKRLAPKKKKTMILGHPIRSGEVGSELLLSSLLGPSPVLVSRLGTTETSALRLLRQRRSVGDKFKKIAEALSTLSGVYPASEQNARRFARLYSNWIQEIDILAVRDEANEYPFWKGEERAIRRYFKGSGLISIEDLFPVEHDRPWTSVLENSRVLVVHPFEQTIKSQALRLDKIFPNNEIPIFEVETFRPPQFLAQSSDRLEFASWFEGFADASEKLERKLAGFSPDFVMVGAGALGLGLAVVAKKAGFRVVHLGGVLQLFFGIQGKRWDATLGSDGRFRGNKFWTRPNTLERPAGLEDVEGGCYW